MRIATAKRQATSQHTTRRSRGPAREVPADTDTRRLILIMSDDGGFEFVRIAGSPEQAKAFCEGFNFAQGFSEGKAVTGDQAMAWAIADLQAGREPAGAPAGAVAAAQAAAV